MESFRLNENHIEHQPTTTLRDTHQRENLLKKLGVDKMKIEKLFFKSCKMKHFFFRSLRNEEKF
jgi:hypothetical protein